MEQFDKHSDDALNELLRKYLLEESERDQLADEALEMHADYVFSEEPLVLPSAAREQEMISKLQERVTVATAAGKSYWRIIWMAPVLVLLIVGLWLGFRTKPTTQVAQTTAIVIDDTLPTTYNNATTASIHKPIDTIATNPIIAEAKPKKRKAVETEAHKPEALPSIFTPALHTSNNSITADTRPQADLKALTKQVLRKTNQYISQQPAERIYAHTDRDVYQPGQDIWFSIYLRNEFDLLPSTISDIVKVQLSDFEGKIVAAIELAAKDGIAKGDIHLAHGLPEGIYHFKAYTAWQQNIPSDFKFEKNIIINEPDITFNNDTVRKKLLKSSYPPITSGAGTDATAAIRVEFYPEGGEMLSGHEGRVAFQVMDKNSEPIAVEGYVADQNGKHVATFNTAYRGMGMFKLQPDTANTYKAFLTKPAGIKNTFDLPKATSTGLALVIDKVERESASITIHSSTDTKVLLIAQVRGEIVYTHQYELKQGDNTLAIPTKSFPAGVGQFTVFNAYGEPVAERLAFVNKYKLLSIQLTTDKAQYQPREKATMNVKVTDDKGQPVQGNFSLSVHDAQPLAMQLSGQGNIISKLLLEPDLNGHVDDAAAYFDNKDPLANNHLDLLLMTRGWRKFSWKQLLNDAPTAMKYSSEKGILKGTVIDPLTGLPQRNIRVEVKGYGVKLLTDNEGRFEIRRLDLSEPKEIILSHKSGLMTFVANRYDGNITIAYFSDNRRVYQPPINDAMHPIISGVQKLPKDSAAILGQITDIYGNGMPNVSVTAQTGGKTVKNTATDAQGFYTLLIDQNGEYLLETKATGYLSKTLTTPIKQGNSVITDMQLTPEKQLMSEVRVAEEREKIKVKDPDAKYYYLAPGQRLLAAGDKNAILENTPEQDKEDLAKLFSTAGAIPGEMTYYFNGMKLRPNEPLPISIARLQSISRENGGVPARYDANGPVIDITTTNSDYSFTGTDKNKPSDFAPRYYKAREFPTVKYKVRERPDKPNDFRGTIYWNGNVSTDINGKATVEFFNSDEVTTFAADMEGLSEKGTPGFGNTSFSTQIPFKVMADIPAINEQTKHITVPVYFSNISGSLLNGKLEYRFPDLLKSTAPLTKDYTIFPAARDTLQLDLDVLQTKVSGKLEIIFTTNGYQYVFSQNISVARVSIE